MFSFSEDNQFFHLTFNEEIIKSNENHKIFENEIFIFDSWRLKNFLDSFQGIKVKEIIKEKNKISTFKLKVQKFKKLNKTKNTLHSKNNISECRHNISELSTPFFLKNYLSENGTPKNYQTEGIDWLLKNEGRLMADDMGLGKTFQSIYAATKYIVSGKAGTVLVLCPVPLIENWAREIEEWAPDFTSTIISSMGKDKNFIWEEVWGYSHFVITNYEQLRDLPEVLKKDEIKLIIADEVHKLRKASSRISKSIKTLSYKNFWGLSGTPVEKNENDVKNILKIIDPRLSETELKELSNFSLSALIDKYILRRMKASVLNELKGFEEKNHLIELNRNQLKQYKNTLKKSSIKKTTDVLAVFGKLRQICDLDIETRTSSKIDFVIELLEKIKIRDEKAVIFSFWIDPLMIMKERIEKSFGKNNAELFIGDLNKSQREKSLESFKSNKDAFVLLCSGKLGGEGINLVEANHAIFFNLWWNPSNNEQARDRLVRIGQEKNVFIHILESANTIENKIKYLLKDKNEISKDLIDQAIKEEMNK